MKGSTFKRCSCRDPETRKLLHRKCPLLTRKGHGAWWYRYDAPRTADGKRRQPMVGPYATQKEAEAALSVELARVGGGGPALDRSALLSTYLTGWLAAKVDLGPDTHASYEKACRLYFIPALGHIRMVDLRDHHVAELVREMGRINHPLPDGKKPSEMLRRLLDARTDSTLQDATDGGTRRKKSTRPLSPATIRRNLAVLNSALNYAVNSSKALTHNPAEHVALPKARRRRPVVWTAAREAAWREAYARQLAETAEYRRSTGIRYPTNLVVWRSTPRPSPVMVWTPQQTGAFLDSASGDRLYALFHLVAYRGLRRGEVVGLTWVEVDLDEGTVTIRDVLDEDLDPDDPKSAAGIRTISLDAETVAVLRAWRKRQSEERLELGEIWVNTGLVFTREDGRKLRDEAVSERFESLARRADLPPIRFHDLRHGAATLGLAAGVPMKIISETLGHTRSSFTADTYTSVIPEVAKAAADAVAAIVPRSRKTSP